MDDCAWCNLSDENKKYQLFHTHYWKIFLADKQDYIGRCVLVCKRHVESLDGLSDEEWIDLKKAVSKLERSISNVFGATMFNWSCLMNDFFKSDTPNPHLHIHLRPRYQNPIIIDGKAFYDDDFAHHYNNKKTSMVNEKEFNKIYQMLKEQIINSENGV